MSKEYQATLLEGDHNPPAASTVIRSSVMWWTMERGLYAAAVLIGLGLRVWQLGNSPLSAWEASNVWPAWLAAQGLAVADAPLPNSPLQYNLHWLTFWLGMHGDAATRWVSASAGTMLIVTPWWLRLWLGRKPAVIAAFLFAVDPWLLLFSRLADGASLALLIGMGALVGLIYLAHANLVSKGAARATVAVLAGLLLVSGPMGWNLLPVLALCAWLWRRELTSAGLRTRATLSVAAAAAVVGGTMFATRIEGLSWLASSLSVWWAQLDGQPAGLLLPVIAGTYGVGWPWLRLVVDAPFAGLLGAAGLVILWVESQRRNALLMTGWLAWGILLWLAPGRSPLALPVAGLALNLLAAAAVSRLAAARPAEVIWREVGAVVLTAAIMLISGVFQATTFGSLAVFDGRLGQTVVVIAALIVAILVAYGVWASRGVAAWTGAVIVTAALALFMVRSGFALVQEQARLAPLGLQALQTNPEVRRLAEDIKTLSAHTTGDPTEQPVQVQVAAVPGLAAEPMAARPDPVLAWYLRDMRRLTWVAGPNVHEGTRRPLIVMLNAEVVFDEGQSGYIGSDYDVEVYWQPDLLVGRGTAAGDDESVAARLWPPVRTWWRWWMYREIPNPPLTRTVTLWAPMQVAEVP